MNEIQKLIRKLKEVLEPQTLNEMSMAFHYKDRYVEVCAWVENPTSRDNRYFKYYDSEYSSTASKVARIRIDRPDYVGGNHKERNLKKWTLSKNEKQFLMTILKSESDDYKGLTKWQDILITYNRDNFHIKAEDTINGNIDKGTRNPLLIDKIKPFPIDYPMPNYLELEE